MHLIAILDWIRDNWGWVVSAAGTLAAALYGGRYSIRKTVKKRVEELEEKMKSQPNVDQRQDKRIDSIEGTLREHQDALTKLSHGQDLLKQQFDLTNKNADERHSEMKSLLNRILDNLPKAS